LTISPLPHAHVNRVKIQQEKNELFIRILNGENTIVPKIDNTVKYLPILLSDEEPEIRKSALDMIESLFRGCSKSQLRPFTTSLSACCSLVLSHINWVVRSDGLKLAGFLLDYLDEKIVAQKIEADISRLLKGTKKKELRNKLINMLLKILKPSEQNETNIVLSNSSGLFDDINSKGFILNLYL
jgi:hypothetical protein